MLVEDVERVLSAQAADDLATASVDDIRLQRAACAEVETQVSYLRRLVQGRLDIVTAELRHRVQGTGATPLIVLVEGLPEVLADNVHGRGGFGRLPTQIEPAGAADIAAEADAVVDASVLTALPELPDEQLESIADRLRQYEQEASALRQSLHARIDALQEELTRRYKVGEVTVDSLLE